MKNNKNKLIFLLLLLAITIFSPFSINSYANTNNLSSKLNSTYPFPPGTLIVRDNDSKTSLPNRFRNLPNLNISGSAEFSPMQLENIKSTINNKNLYIVDLRQESHGYINETPISFYNKETLLNKGFTTAQTLEAEKNELASIKVGSDINIYHKNGDFIETLHVDKVFSEETLVKKNNINYMRFAVRDGGIPTPKVTDDFVTFINNLTDNTHLHFHCLEGQGRTTTFMSLYQMMKNTDKIPLETILNQQLEAGGIVINDNAERSAFLHSFYNYTLDNIDSNFTTPYSTWLKSNT